MSFLEKGIVTPAILKLKLYAMNKRLFNLHKTATAGTLQQKWSSFLIVQSDVHYNQTAFTASWSKSLTLFALLTTRAKLLKISNILQFKLLSCRAPTFPFWGLCHHIKHLPIWPLTVSIVSVVRLREIFRIIESMVKVKWLGPTLGVRLTNESVS